VHIRFLLGPAGSGKTHRCLTEIREALRNDPDGLPLVLLAPKQATFQLERQLLSSGNLSGYTRLRILSFERLAQFVFEQLNRPLPKLLSEDGRVMVLRALLERQRTTLKLFRASARMPGFATQLSQLLRELQQYHFTPDRLEKLSLEVGDSNRLNSKLSDLAVILGVYSDWLCDQKLQDADCLLDLAAALAASDFKTGKNSFRIEGLWLDGFAQMTPQERQLLAAVAQHSERTTLAFCVDGEPQQNPPWHSLWAPVTETFLRCRDQFSILPDAQITVEALPRNPAQSRFASQPALQHLEQHWGGNAAFTPKLENTHSAAIWSEASLSPREERTGREPERGVADISSLHAPPLPNPLLRLRSEEREQTFGPQVESRLGGVRIVSCMNPEAEVEFAAREIHRYVRETGGRFRDTAVLLRSLDGYHDAVRRVFARYDIPFFLDRRESVTHHPLAELTRYALRVAAFGWEHDDWFGALKTGLVHDDESAIDRLENEALARGWRGKSFWTQPLNLPGMPEHTAEYFERLREKLVPAFVTFSSALESLDHRFSGKQLAEAIRRLWRDLKIDRKMEQWSSDAAENSLLPNPVLHETVWEQMADWLKNVELAFAEESLFPSEWLPIVEAGLGNLTVGVIPPALDQVLVGAVDRSRNPDLQIAFVLGVNEGIFPAPPAAPALLHRVDREKLALHNAPVGPDFLNQIGLERYYGYIACTRARSQVVLTFAHRDNGGQELNPSVFVSDLQRLFPSLTVEEFTGVSGWKSAEHWNELLLPLLSDAALAQRSELATAAPSIEAVLAKWRQLNSIPEVESLPPELVERIYGPELRTSVSALEDFAACPFRFFVAPRSESNLKSIRARKEVSNTRC
jgi:ATP-dependent helicase/nuclease subunit B